MIEHVQPDQIEKEKTGGKTHIIVQIIFEINDGAIKLGLREPYLHGLIKRYP